MKLGHGMRGAGWSVLLHGVIILSLVVLGVSLENDSRLVVIDFSMQQRPAAQPPKAVPPAPVAAPRQPVVEKKPELPKKEIVPQVKPPPPKPKPKKIEKVLPKKAKLAPPVTKKLLPEAPPLLSKKTVETPAESEPAPVVQSPAPANIPVAPVRTPSRVVAAGPIGPPVDIAPGSPPPTAQEQYVAAHFDFIRKEIQQKMVYPVVARRKGWQGRVVLSFIVEKKGTIREIRVVESSGYKILDDKAVVSVQEAAPFPEPPVSAKLIIPVVFRLG